MYNCECLDCGKQVSSEQHCKDIKCPVCGGDMRRVSRPGKGQPINSTKKKSIQAILDDIFFSTKLEVIEGSSDRARNILSKLGIKLPNEDFALIEGIYMLADEANKNKHRVAEEYIMAAVNTLIFKAANYFHDRNHPIGFYIDATYNKDTKKMKSCAIIWKSQFPETYAKIVELIEKEDAGQSFELVFQDSVNNEDGTMDLIGICFKGGAFLPRSKAACEFTDYIIEAKKMENLIVGGKQEELVMERHEELLTIITNAETTDEAFEKAMEEFHGLEESTLEASCVEVKEAEKVVLEKIEGKKISYQERKALKDSDFAYVKEVKNEKTGGTRKVRRFPIQDEAHIRNTLEKLSQAKELSPEEKATIRKKVLRKAKSLDLKALLEKHKDEATFSFDEVMAIEEALYTRIRKVETELKEKSDGNTSTTEEITKVKEELKTAKKQLETLKYSEEDIKNAVKEALERDKKIKERRAEIKADETVKDEDLLDDAKYESLKAKSDYKKLQEEKAALEKKVKEQDVLIKAAKEKLGDELPTGGDITVATTQGKDPVLEGMKEKTNQ